MKRAKKMTNGELADAMEANSPVTMFEREAIRRLRNSVPRELYQKAWEECQDMREREPVTSSTNPGIIHCREAHDLARTAQGEK